jgi:hypothetical protein
MIETNTLSTYCQANEHYFMQWDEYSKAEFLDHKRCECGKCTYGELKPLIKDKNV